MKDWDEDFGDEIGEFLADAVDAAPLSRSTGVRSRTFTRMCSPSRQAADLFALLSIPWTDQETAEFLRLVGLDDPTGN